MKRWRVLQFWNNCGRCRITAILLAAILAGAAIGFSLTNFGNDDEIVVGNTGGTLSVFARVNGAQIVFGGGGSRVDLADLVGRATLPWQRRIDLLIVPGWDNDQAIGALGLIERGQVRQVVIVGEPGTASIWSLLEQQARASSTSYLVASETHRVELPDDSELLLAGSPPTAASPSWAVASLHLRDMRVVFLDASTGDLSAVASEEDIPPAAHLLIASRPISSPVVDAEVWIAPQPQRSRDQLPVGPRFTAELAMNEQLSIGLTTSTLRLPLDKLQAAVPQPR